MRDEQNYTNYFKNNYTENVKSNAVYESVNYVGCA